VRRAARCARADPARTAPAQALAAAARNLARRFARRARAPRAQAGRGPVGRSLGVSSPCRRRPGGRRGATQPRRAAGVDAPAHAVRARVHPFSPSRAADRVRARGAAGRPAAAHALDAVRGSPARGAADAGRAPASRGPQRAKRAPSSASADASCARRCVPSSVSSSACLRGSGSGRRSASRALTQTQDR